MHKHELFYDGHDFFHDFKTINLTQITPYTLHIAHQLYDESQFCWTTTSFNHKSNPNWTSKIVAALTNDNLKLSLHKYILLGSDQINYY